MKTFDRREFIKTTIAAGIIAGSSIPDADANDIAVRRDPAEPVLLNLLDSKPLLVDSGVSFGVPFPSGSVKHGAVFTLTAQSKRMPVKTWPLAFWPDGSIKWMGFAPVVPAGLT